MNTLTISIEKFTEMISDLIASGVTFTAEENIQTEMIKITFTGGY